MQTNVYDTIEEIKKEDWNRLAPKENPEWQYDYYHVLEKSHLPRGKFYYVVVSSSDVIEGIFPFHVFQGLPLDCYECSQHSKNSSVDSVCLSPFFSLD